MGRPPRVDSRARRGVPDVSGADCRTAAPGSFQAPPRRPDRAPAALGLVPVREPRASCAGPWSSRPCVSKRAGPLDVTSRCAASRGASPDGWRNHPRRGEEFEILDRSDRNKLCIIQHIWAVLILSFRRCVKKCSTKADRDSRKTGAKKRQSEASKQARMKRKRGR